jgi:hypothetical protein
VLGELVLGAPLLAGRLLLARHRAPAGCKCRFAHSVLTKPQALLLHGGRFYRVLSAAKKTHELSFYTQLFKRKQKKKVN